MLDPKTSLPVGAPPVAPYDDGFSTESEDFNDQEDASGEVQASFLSIGASSSVRSAVVIENRPKTQRQQIHAGTFTNAIKQDTGKKPQVTAVSTEKTEETGSNRATNGIKTPRNGHVMPPKRVLEAEDEKEEEHCRTCKGYLTPLSERIRMMKTAAQRQAGDGPPESRQCCRCHITYPLVALTDDSRSPLCVQPRCYMCNWAAKAAKKTAAVAVNGVKKVANEVVEEFGRWNTALSGECCRGCKAKLAPLSQGHNMMKEAILQHKTPGPPPSRRCSCCHITYPVAALTVKSREPSCSTPLCEVCEAVSRHPDTEERASRLDTVDADASGRLENGSVVLSENTIQNCCRNCKSVLLPLEERLNMMNETAVKLKEKGWRFSPPTRQCSCCFITYPLAAVTEKSRSVACAAPICCKCSVKRTHASESEEQAVQSSSYAANSDKGKKEASEEPKKTHETIVMEDGEGDEEGELIEKEICNCCRGKLIPPVQRAQMLKSAAQNYGGKEPPPSRQCACCRITYPSAGLTKKSRKMTRAVPICVNCCAAGGPAIYEMLAVSDEFVEAFKVENPDMARQLLKKKSSGTLDASVQNQRKRMMKQTKAPQTLQTLKKILVQQTKPALALPLPSAQMQHTNDVKVSSRTHYCRRHLMPKACRKSMPAPRLIIGNPITGNYAAPQAGDHDAEGADVKQEQSAQQTSHLQPPRSRTARWLKQFELVDGKTARERRLEARNETIERRLEKKRQRTS